MRKYEQEALGATLILFALWVLWKRRFSELGDISYEGLRDRGGGGGDDDDPFDFDWHVPGGRGPSKWMMQWRQRNKRYSREYSAQQKAWEETQQTWGHPSFEREHPR